MSRRFPVTSLTLALASSALPAQMPELVDAATESSAAPQLSAARSLGEGRFRVPIHTHPADPHDGAYGVWASGDTYKVSFHDGFAFYPWLGKSYPDHLPLRWRTTRVTLADQPIADLSAPIPTHDDWRYEYLHDGVREVYDVRPEGVEQSFVFDCLPSLPGDLVVEGRIDTPLVGRTVAAAHQELVFTDAAGNPIVGYGKAFAFDARGRRTEASTAFDGEVIELRVSGAWLAEATMPVTIDPLTFAYLLSADPGHGVESPRMHREDESPVLNTMVAYSRLFTAGDFDLYASLGASDLHASTIVFSDITTGWSSYQADVAFVGGADRWMIGFWRHFAADDRVRVYFHDRENLSLNSGATATNHNPPGEHHSFPAIGGTSHPTLGTEGIMAYRVDPFYGNSSTSEIHVIQLDAASRLFGSSRLLAGADAEAPDVNCQKGWNEDGWVVVYQQRSSATDDYDVIARRVTHQLATSPLFQIGPDNLGDKVRPVVQGWDGRYLCAMLQDATAETHGRHFARNVLVQRIDWQNLITTPTTIPFRTVSRSPNQDLTQLELAFDGVTRSHWCLVHDSDVFSNPKTLVKRLGFTGAVTESVDLGAVSYHAAATWNGVRQEFLIVSCSNSGLAPLWGQLLQHSGAAVNSLYGGSCGPGVIASETIPHPGSQFYRVKLEGAPPGQVSALCLSTGTGATELSSIGAANCWNNLASFDVIVPMSTGPLGTCWLEIALPDAPLFTGDLYWQFLYSWPAAPTPLTLGTTRGLHAAVR